MKRSQWLYEVITYLLILLFFFTALGKVMDWHHYERKMNNQVFSKTVTPIITVAVPLVEFMAVLLLAWVKTRMSGLWLSLALMGAFTVYVGLVTFNVFPRVPCSCAGVFEAMTWPQHLVFNVVFTVITGIAIYIGNKEKQASAAALA